MEIERKDLLEDYCSLELSKLLKERGFNMPCWTFYDKDDKLHINEQMFNGSVTMGIWRPKNENLNSDCCTCPTHQMALQWLRDTFNIYISTDPCNVAIGYIIEMFTDDYYSQLGSGSRKSTEYWELIDEAIIKALNSIN